jgi:hypothetical protein
MNVPQNPGSLLALFRICNATAIPATVEIRDQKGPALLWLPVRLSNPIPATKRVVAQFSVMLHRNVRCVGTLPSRFLYPWHKKS